MAGLLAQWWAETSVALQRANAEALLASLGDQSAGEGLDEDGEQDDPGLGCSPSSPPSYRPRVEMPLPR